MRPTDENQQSTRPNLMSSGRRSGNEESILAQLERDAGRGGGGRASRLAWYGGGAAVAVCLLGVLVWLARDQSATEVIMAQAPVELQSGHAVHGGEIAPAPAPRAAEDAQRPMAQAATIVDEPQPAASAHQQHEVPPLVLLSPQQGAKAGASTPTPAQAQPAERAGTATVVDIGTPAATAVTATVPAKQTPAVADTVAVAPAEPKRATKAIVARQDSTRPRGSAKATAAPTHPASHHPAARHTAKPKKQAAPAQPAEKVDSDVALISAVIQHASNRANAADADCGTEAKCAAKATPEP